MRGEISFLFFGMKGTIRLELIGAPTRDSLRAGERILATIGARTSPTDRISSRAWVAELYRDIHGDLRYSLLTGKRNYSQANRDGSRGVMVWYVLEEDKLYLVHSPRSWTRNDVYYATVTPRGEVARRSQEEAELWPNAR
jgi:hypothetical protein